MQRITGSRILTIGTLICTISFNVDTVGAKIVS